METARYALYTWTMYGSHGMSITNVTALELGYLRAPKKVKPF